MSVRRDARVENLWSTVVSGGLFFLIVTSIVLACCSFVRCLSTSNPRLLMSQARVYAQNGQKVSLASCVADCDAAAGCIGIYFRRYALKPFSSSLAAALRLLRTSSVARRKQACEMK
jgi:hypothetical protein